MQGGCPPHLPNHPFPFFIIKNFLCRIFIVSSEALGCHRWNLNNGKNFCHLKIASCLIEGKKKLLTFFPTDLIDCPAVEKERGESLTLCFRLHVGENYPSTWPVGYYGATINQIQIHYLPMTICYSVMRWTKKYRFVMQHFFTHFINEMNEEEAEEEEDFLRLP